MSSFSWFVFTRADVSFSDPISCSSSHMNARVVADKGSSSILFASRTQSGESLISLASLWAGSSERSLSYFFPLSVSHLAPETPY